MSWRNIKIEDLNFAMNECEKSGIAEVRRLYGFTKAKNIHIYHNGRGPFEARVLIAMAYSKRYPEAKRLVPADFTNDDAHIFLAKSFDFEVFSINTGERRQRTRTESLRDLLRAANA